MAEYAPGMRTIIRDEEWMVKKIETNSLGNKALHCVGVSPLVKDREAIFLTDLEEIQIVNPAEVKLVPDHSPRFRKSLLYLESQWRQKIPTDTNIHIGYKAAMDPMPYQLDPAKQALQRPRQRILIADTVGLGKTLEAGILMSELIARGKGKRILVVTVKSMMTQFQKEMWNRFTIPLVRLDSNRIQKIRASLPSNYNPFFYYDKTIVSIDTLKRDVEYRTHLENAYWDIIVIDEAQNVADRGDHQAQRSRLAKLLADRSDTMIMLSATPHDGRAKSFASLMNMLDPTAIANPEDYTKDDIKGLCIRRFKENIKDQVNGAFLERTVTLERCHASAREERAFNLFADMELQMDIGRERGSSHLFKTSLEKSLFSSPAACIKSIDARLAKLNKKYDFADIKDIGELESLRDALMRIKPQDFSRYQKLLELLRSPEYGWDSNATGYAYNDQGLPLTAKGEIASDVMAPDHAWAIINLDGIRVGGSAQTTAALGADIKIDKHLSLGADWNFMGRNYSYYSFSGSNLSIGKELTIAEPWRVPAACTVDLNGRYKFKIGNLDATFSGNINNLLNYQYILKAWNPSSLTTVADETNIYCFFDTGRTYTLRLKVAF